MERVYGIWFLLDVLSVLTQAVEQHFLFKRIDDPVFGHAASFILRQLPDPVARNTLFADDLNTRSAGPSDTYPVQHADGSAGI